MGVDDDRGQGSASEEAPREQDFGRQPPQDLTAEQSVLGGMMLSKDAIADVIERVRSATSTAPPISPCTRRSWSSTA